MVVMKCAGLASGDPCSVEGQFLKSFDAEAHNGHGTAVFTTNLEEAKKFDRLEDAFNLLRTIPKNRPWREEDEEDEEDKKPNRPLTAFHMELVTI